MPTIIKTKRGLNLSIKQAEYIYSNLDLHENTDSLAEQRYVRLQVSQIYETGREDVNQNRWKAKKYLAEATAATQVKHGFWSSETAFTLLGLYTLIRSQVTRLNTLFKHEYIGKAFLNRLFGIAGLSYFVELSYDLYLTTKFAYQTMPVETEEEKQASFFQRFASRCKLFVQHFKNAIEEEEGRKNRMVNCAVWGAINLTLFLVTFGWSFLLNLTGFFIDVWNVYHKRYHVVAMHEDLLNQISEKVTEIKSEELELYNKRHQLILLQKERQNELLTCFDPEKTTKIKQDLLDLQNSLDINTEALTSNKKDLLRFEYEQKQISKKTEEEKKERIKAVTIVTLVLISVTLSSPIPGLNLTVSAIAAFVLVAVTAYVTITKLWDIGKKIGRFLHKTYQDYKNSDVELQHNDNHILMPVDGHTVSSTEKIKQDLRSNIQFLKSCKEKIAGSGSLAETFAEFTPDDIHRLRKIFNMKKDDHWKEQIKYLIRHAKDDCETVHQTKNKQIIYRCSFNKFLDKRIEQDRALGLMLDEKNSNLIAERLQKLEQETDHKYEPIEHEPEANNHYHFA